MPITSCVQNVERKERQSFSKREQSPHFQKLAGGGARRLVLGCNLLITT
jgi:hypothetical protein